MTINENPDLEDALDGLIEAGIYADEIGEPNLSYEIARCYSKLVVASPDDHWDDGHEPHDDIPMGDDQ